MRRLLFFCLFLNPIFGFENPSKIGHEIIEAKILRVVAIGEAESKNRKYILFSNKGNFEIKSENKLATVKIASFLKMKESETKRIVLHFQYIGSPSSGFRFYRKVCNAFQN